jgi:MFS family permease
MNTKNDSFINNIKFVNFDGKLMIMWSIIGSIIFYYASLYSNTSLWLAMVVIISGLIIGFALKIILLIKNKKIHELNTLDASINLIFIYNSVTLIFASTMTIVLHNIGAYALIFPIWLFSIFIVRFIIGTMSHCNSCKYTSIIAMILSFLMMLFVSAFPEYIKNELLINIYTYISIFLFFIIFFFLGIYKINKKVNNNFKTS